MLVIARSDHHRVQLGIGEHLFGVLIRLRPASEQPPGIVCRSFAIHRPQVADAAQVEVRIGFGGHLEHLSMTRGPVPAADLANLDPIVRPDDPRVRTRCQQQGAAGEKLSARDGVHGSLLT